MLNHQTRPFSQQLLSNRAKTKKLSNRARLSLALFQAVYKEKSFSFPGGGGREHFNFPVEGEDTGCRGLKDARTPEGSSKRRMLVSLMSFRPVTRLRVRL